MSTDTSPEVQEPDEFRPSKRVRLEAPLDVSQEVQEEVIDDDDEGWDDIYGIGKEAPSLAKEAFGNGAAVSTSDQNALNLAGDAAGLMPEVVEPPSEGHLELAPKGEHAQIDGAQDDGREKEVKDDIPDEAVDSGDDLVVEHDKAAPADRPSLKMLGEVSGLNGDPNANLTAGDAGGQTNAKGEVVQPAANAASVDAPKVAAAVEESLSSSLGKDESLKAEEGQEDEDFYEQNQKPVAVPNGDPEAKEETKKRTTDGPIDAMESQNKPPAPKATEDAEFMVAAAAQKSNAEAEWQFDSSDAESSSSDSSDSSDSSSDSESDDDGYEMLDAATVAKMLMSGEGEDDDEGGGKKKGSGEGPKTANEQTEAPVPKPDVAITEDMKITELGTVERTVGCMVLIKGATPGEYQVLEQGSVLCNEKREVVGAVAETFGRVQEPMYSVAFSSVQEIEDAGLTYGNKVYYVDAHSKFVFTQPLKNMRGTDASNIHDEEVGEDEVEFSDDEAEAEFKRQKKLAKKAGRGGMTGANGVGRGGRPRAFGAPDHDSGHSFASANHGDAPQQSYGGGMSYDDDNNDGVAEEFYSPLKRPDNLSELMTSGGPPRPQNAHFNRGSGRGRGRGDRGRGRGGFHQDRNHRGGRGGFGGQASGPHRGSASSFPDRHNNAATSGHKQHTLPPKPSAPSGSAPPAQPPQQQQTYNHYQQPFQQSREQAPQQPQPQTYQFNGYTFQYGNGPPPSQPTQQAIGYSSQQQPPGSFLNPAFSHNQPVSQPRTQWSLYQPPHAAQQQTYGGWNASQQQQQQPPPPYVQPVGAPTPEQQQNLAEILRRMGGSV